MHQLYYQGGIDSIVFTRETGDVGGALHFGTHINEKEIALPYTAQCVVKMFIDIWSCYIILITKHQQEINTETICIHYI